MNVKYLKTDPSDSINIKKLKYINEVKDNRAYYLPLIGGELEWEIGRIVTHDELFKGRSLYDSGEVYIWVVQHIFRLMNVPLFDLGIMLKIHELNNTTDLRLLKIHIHNATNRSKLEDKEENQTKGNNLKERINEIIEFIELELPQTYNTTENKINPTEKKDFSFNSNDWNEYTYNLFKYLIEHYYKDKKQTKRKLTNIWFYFNDLVYNRSNIFEFNFTKDQYKAYVLSNINVRITNFDRVNKYYDEVKKLKRLTEEFNSTL